MASVVCVLLTIVFITNSVLAKVDFQKANNAAKTDMTNNVDSNDQGQLANCGQSEGGSDFTLTWSPAALKVGQMYAVSATGTAKRDFKGQGVANVTVWLPQYPQTPFYQSVQKVSCDEAIPYVHGIFKCPVAKGQTFNVSGMKVKAPSKLEQVPPGDYNVEARLMNSDNQLFICAKGSIKVL